MKRILVTGGTGFLGRPTVARLASHYEVHVLSSNVVRKHDPPVVRHYCDLLLEDPRPLLARIRPELVLHLAWIAEHSVFWQSPLNEQWVDASGALLDAFLACGGRRFIVAGSCAEYGPSAAPLREDALISPESPYGRAKARFHKILEARTKGRAAATWARLFFLYGPGEPETKFIPQTARTHSSGQVPLLRNPQRRLDFIHVDDAASAFAHLVDVELPGAVNVGSGIGYTIEQVAALVRATVEGSTAPSLVEPVVWNSGDVVADIERLRATGFRPKISLADGIRSEVAR